MIKAEQLTRRYGDFLAVDSVSFAIEPGEIVGLLGHNGAGKTTIMKMMTGFLEPSSGSVEVDGRVVRLEEVSAPRRGQKAAFIMDTRLCDAAVALAEDCDLLICESTYVHDDHELAVKHGHMTALEAATIAREAGARRLVLTHFSRRYPDPRVFLDEARTVFEDCVLAEDGLRVAVPPR